MDGLAHAAQAIREHGAIERELVGEVVVNHRLVDAGVARDVIHADTVETGEGELRGRRIEHGITSGNGGGGFLASGGHC